MFAYTLGWLVVIFGSINLVRMAFFMIGSDIYGVRHALRKRKQFFRQLPTVSVVIPAHNEEHTIVRAVSSICNAAYPREKLQIIVVDDGSTDRTAKIVRAAFGPRVHIVTQTNAGKAHALNRGMRDFAKGELVMCLDADSTLDRQALMNAVRYFADPRVKALASNVKIRSSGTLLNLIQQFEYFVCYQMKRAQTLFNVEYIIGGIGSTFRRNALARVGFYDTDTQTEDIDLTFKLLRSGNKDARVVYGADVITYTESVLSIGDLIRQRHRWKYGRAQTFLKNAEMFFSTNRRHNIFLTWFYLPYALFCDLAFFLEPFVIGYIIYIILAYRDWVTLASSFTIIGGYIALNILAEDTIHWKDKIRLAVIAPSMYLFFYCLSYVEYIALIRTYAGAHKIPGSIGGNVCGWQHVARMRTAGE